MSTFSVGFNEEACETTIIIVTVNPYVTGVANVKPILINWESNLATLFRVQAK